jgi:hypothetical protein
MTKPIEMWMLRTEALRVSKNHIRAVLRSKGFKLSTFSQAELNSLARRWFEANRTELIGQALGSLARANLVTYANQGMDWWPSASGWS